jgi:hypothetical protein
MLVGLLGLTSCTSTNATDFANALAADHTNLHVDATLSVPMGTQHVVIDRTACVIVPTK